jgi:putative flavoprotein involved in K+ transport
MDERHDIVVIGAGQAGLAMSYWLSARGREHVVLERASVAERWRRERWDSLYFQFPNSFLQLPGFEYRGPEPNAFAHHGEIIRYVEDYGRKIAAPVQLGVDVRALAHDEQAGIFRLIADRGSLTAQRVVIATGPFQRPLIPECAAALPPDIVQMHASAYHNPGQLPPGSVLIVGSGSSGCQIAEELQHSGRTVYLSVGRHRRIPHRYRGRYMLDWLADLGIFDLPVDNLSGGEMPPPLVVTGVNGGHGINLRRFAAEGIVLLGSLVGIQDGKAGLGADAEQRMTEADQAAQDLVQQVDEYVRRMGLVAADPDPRDVLELDASAHLTFPATLDLKAAGISTVIWCTGYAFDFEWVRLPIFDERGRPAQRRGVTACRGAYFLGLHWMHTFKSGTLFGVGQDAEYLAEHMLSRR